MSDTPDVLIVEDEVELASATAEYLRATGLSVKHASNAKDALALVQDCAPPVVLLDVNLPDASGFELCRQLRALPAATQPSVIFVSARASDLDQVQGLAVGADDFVTKPFSLAVLVAKVRRALERRTDSHSAGTPGNRTTVDTPGSPPDYEDSRLRVEFSTGRTYLEGRELKLTTLEDRILRHLVYRRGQVCTKAQIITGVWGDQFTSEGTLTVHIRHLRTHIEPNPDAPTYIRTVWGRGYLFEGR